MRKHQEHRFLQQSNWRIYGHSTCLHATLAGVSDYHEKILYLNLGPTPGVSLILERDLYSNKYGMYSRSEISNRLTIYISIFYDYWGSDTLWPCVFLA